MLASRLRQAAGSAAANVRRLCSSSSSSSSKQKLSYACGVGSEPLLGSTIGQLLDEAADRDADREAFVFCFDGDDDGGQELRRTIGEFRSEVDRVASGLLAAGLRPGDRLGVWGPNSVEWLTAQYAAAKAGLVLVSINPGYRAHELQYCLNLVGARGLLAAASFKTSDYYGMLSQLCPQLPEAAPGRLRCGAVPSLSHVIMMGANQVPGTISYSELAAAAPDVDELRRLGRRQQADDVANVQFTSGTTGSPKGAALTHHNIVNNAYFVGKRCRYHEVPARICVQVPFYHCFGMGLGNLQIVLHRDAACVYPAPSFEPGASLLAVQRHGCNSLYGTPTMFIDMLSHPSFAEFDLSSLRTGIIAGSPCPVEVMKKVVQQMHMREVTIAYGTTENGPVTFQGLPDDSLERRCGSVGRPSEHVEVRIVDAEGRTVPQGERGEICIRGYCVMRGYYNDEAKTREAIGADRWYRTGDIGLLDADGYGHVRGRIADLVIRGGENLYPVEIENFLHTHPAVADVQVVGVPDPRMGEELCAVVKTQPGRSLTPQQLRDFCRGEIAHFKIPRHVLLADSFPMTVTGKVQKFKLRQWALQQLGISEDSDE